jgi:predicted dehydrogenase
MDKLRVGIIGAGRISDLHALEYLANPRAEIVAVCDAHAPNAQTRGHAWGVAENRIFTDYHDLLALPEVDLVEILLPHHLHHTAVLDAATAHKHVSVQKPMAFNADQAQEMIDATQRAGVIFKVFENFIFYPPVQRAKALVDAGEIGDPLSIRIKSNAATSPTAWQVPHAAQAWRF